MSVFRMPIVFVALLLMPVISWASADGNHFSAYDEIPAQQLTLQEDLRPMPARHSSQTQLAISTARDATHCLPAEEGSGCPEEGCGSSLCGVSCCATAAVPECTHLPVAHVHHALTAPSTQTLQAAGLPALLYRPPIPAS